VERDDAGYRRGLVSWVYVETSLNIEAQLPKPAALRWIPHALLSGAAHNIFLLRLDEVINGFIDQSKLAYSPKEDRGQ